MTSTSELIRQIEETIADLWEMEETADREREDFLRDWQQAKLRRAELFRSAYRRLAEATRNPSLLWTTAAPPAPQM